MAKENYQRNSKCGLVLENQALRLKTIIGTNFWSTSPFSHTGYDGIREVKYLEERKAEAT